MSPRFGLRVTKAFRLPLDQLASIRSLDLLEPAAMSVARLNLIPATLDPDASGPVGRARTAHRPTGGRFAHKPPAAGRQHPCPGVVGRSLAGLTRW